MMPPMFTMRFDLRAPAGTAPTTDLYAAAIDMAAWAEDRGCAAAIISEHHSSPDGYLPAPLLLASAMAGRTTKIPMMIAAALLPFYEPIRLAEEMVVLDIISRGRVSYVFGIGYRPRFDLVVNPFLHILPHDRRIMMLKNPYGTDFK